MPQAELAIDCGASFVLVCGGEPCRDLLGARLGARLARRGGRWATVHDDVSFLGPPCVASGARYPEGCGCSSWLDLVSFAWSGAGVALICLLFGGFF